MSTTLELTGGSRDTNPQFISGTITESANDTTTSLAVPLPIDRLRNKGDLIGVVEILKVYVAFRQTNVFGSYRIIFSTKNFGTTATFFNDPTVFAMYAVNDNSFSDISRHFFNLPFTLDVTDAAGHGVLVATDQFFVQLTSTTSGSTMQSDFKILYRYKDVSITEYVGIVQSQV